MAIRDLVRRRRDYGEPGLPLTSLHRAMDRLFDDLFGEFDLFAWPQRHAFGAFRPRLDVEETDTEYHVSAELPGMDEKDVKVRIDEDTLVIEGEKKHEQEKKGQGYYRSERSYGSFRRVVPLSGQIDVDKIDAHFKKGVLTITLPKLPEAQRQVKHIPIQTD